jgi:hypothetical protein
MFSLGVLAPGRVSVTFRVLEVHSRLVDGEDGESVGNLAFPDETHQIFHRELYDFDDLSLSRF